MTDLLALTAELVDVPSVSFAEGPLVDRLEQELGQLDHLEVTRVGDNLVARTDLGRDRRLILAGHTDTVPANGNAEARIDGDTALGRRIGRHEGRAWPSSSTWPARWPTRPST